MTISLIIIYGLHQVWLYLINTYSEKKTNRIIDKQITQYKEIIENLSMKKEPEPKPETDDETMSQDLETFLNTISNS
jgi:hypothetical protein